MHRLVTAPILPSPGIPSLGYMLLHYNAGATFVMTLKSQQHPPIPCILTLAVCSFDKDGSVWGAFQVNGKTVHRCYCMWKWKEKTGDFSMTVKSLNTNREDGFSFFGTIDKETLEVSLVAETAENNLQMLTGGPLSSRSAFKQSDAAASSPFIINCLNNVGKEELEIREDLLNGCLYLSLFNDTVMMRPPVFTLKGRNRD